MAAIEHPSPAFAPSALTGLADETLAGLVAAGSDDAFAVLDARYRRRLVRHARGFVPCGGADAEDAAQDALVRALRALRGGRSKPDAVGPWLHRIARNCALDISAARRRAPVIELVDGDAPRMGSAGEDAHAALERRQSVSHLVADVGGLPEVQRAALVLRELEGRSYVDIADELDVTVPAVKSLLVRARSGLKRAREARRAAAAAWLPLPLLGRVVDRLAAAWEPVSAATAPKVACVAVVAAGSIPALAMVPGDPPPATAAKTPVVHAAGAQAPPTAPAGASGDTAPKLRRAALPPDDGGSAGLRADCADGYLDEPASRSTMLAELRHSDPQAQEYTGCRAALVAALTRAAG